MLINVVIRRVHSRRSRGCSGCGSRFGSGTQKHGCFWRSAVKAHFGPMFVPRVPRVPRGWTLSVCGIISI
jgi:hypothetical protein